ncbi:MAG: STAS domain-containing protein [Gaiellales bacterium]
MPETGFEAQVRSGPDRVVIDLYGQIDGAAREGLAAVYEQADAVADVLLNFEGVEYINSTGIALIVGLLGRARADGRSLAACGLSDHYREIFQVTRLADFIPLYADEASAAFPEDRS